MILISVRVHPNSGRQEIIREDESHFIAYLKSSPENGKANAELSKLLHNYFKAEVRIKSGLKSRNKIIEILG